MMHSNPLVKRWQENRPTLNGWLSLANVNTAEIMAKQGFDSITIDMQHGLSDYTTMASMLPSIQGTGTVAMARVPWLDPAYIMKTLDAGVAGIICPMINSEDDAKKLVQYAYYPPLGGRSYGPIRAKHLYPKNYAAIANDELLIFAMIETRQAIDNLDSILAVPGIDAVYIGPADLSLNLGASPKFDQEDERVLEKIAYVLKKAKAAGKFAGIHNGTVAYAKRMSDMGFDFLTVGSDASFIESGAQKVVADFNKLDANQSNHDLSDQTSTDKSY